MDIVVKNEELSVRVATLGAEMQSVQDSEGTEYLWNGDSAFWLGRAPNLFPYIARLTNETYTLHGKPYHMGIHGFAAKTEFAVEKQTESEVAFLLCDSTLTRESYPFRFEFRVTYRLLGRRIRICYAVGNKDHDTMYFGLGGHPGFSLPFERGLKFEDYYLEFDEATEPIRVGFSDTCFLSGEDKPFFLMDGTKLLLSHELFNNDAIVLKNMANGVTLKSRHGSKSLRVEYPQMRYLGIWHKPGTHAPYVCIEPWTSLPSRQSVVEEFTLQKDLVKLPKGAVYHNEWEIELCGKS